MKKIFLLFVFMMLLTGMSQAKEMITSVSQLNNPEYIIGTDGSSPLHYIAKRFFPNAKFSYYTEVFNGYAALKTGKIDAFVVNQSEAEVAINNGLEGVRLLPEILGEPINIAAGISRKTKIKNLKEKFNAFIAELKADGTLDKMSERWRAYKSGDEIPDIKVPEKSDIKLRVATTGTVMPFTFYADGTLSGLDIELSKRFAAYLGAEIKFEVYNFSSILTIANSKKADIALSNLYATPEHAESMNFSDTIYTINPAVLVRGDKTAPVKSTKKFSDFYNKKIAVVTGTIQDRFVKEHMPDAEILYFQSTSDCIGAVSIGKADAFCNEELLLKLAVKDNNNLTIADGYLDKFNYALIFGKNSKSDKLRGEFNEYLSRVKSNGKLKQIQDIWFGDDDSLKIFPDYENLPDINGTVKVAVYDEAPPFAYIKDGRLTGYEIDLITNFCKEKGYKPVLTSGNAGYMLPSVTSGRCDLGMGSVTVTEERKENLNFSDPTYTGGAKLLVLKNANEVENYNAGLVKNTKKVSDFDGKRIAVKTGAIHDGIVREALPNAQILYFDTASDAMLAMLNGKVETFVSDEDLLKTAVKENNNFAILDGYLNKFDYALIFAKNSKGYKLQSEFNEYLSLIKSDGTFQQIQDIWFGDDESLKIIPDYKNLPDTNGTINIVATDEDIPFDYIKNGQLTGYEIDLITRFCKEKGYKPEFTSGKFSIVIPSVASEKSDIGMGAITVTEERKESVNFSDPIYTGGARLLVLKDRTADKQEGQDKNKIETKNFKTLPVLRHSRYGRKAAKKISDFDSKDKRIAVVTGTVHSEIVKDTLPSAEIMYFETISDGIGAMLAGKVDACVEDEGILQTVLKENDKFSIADGYLKTFDNAWIFAKNSKGDKLRSEFNEYLKKIKSDGTLQQINDIWCGYDEDKKIPPEYENLQDTNATIKIAVSNESMPFSYVKNNKLAGYEIDLITRFCKEKGYKPEFTAGKFSIVIPSVVSGKCDIGMGSITITEERKESVNFSDPIYTGGSRLLVLKDAASVEPVKSLSDGRQAAKKFSDFDGKRIAVMTGTTNDKFVHEALPNAKIFYLESDADAIASILTGKIEGYSNDEEILRAIVRENDNFIIADGYLKTYDFALIFGKSSKSSKLRSEFNEYLKQIKSNGILQQINDIWLGDDESKKIPPEYENLQGNNGTIKIAVSNESPPFSYVKNNKLAGYEVDLITRFCKEKGYKLVFSAGNFSSVIPAVVTGKCDLGMGSVTITEERKESVNFSDPTYRAGSRLLVLKDAAPVEPVKSLPDGRQAAKKISDFEGKRIAVITGAVFDDNVREVLPTAKILYFENIADTVAALTAGKVDAAVNGEESLKELVRQNDEFAIIDGYLKELHYALIFAKTSKGDKLRGEFNEYLRRIKSNGIAQQINSIWFGNDESKKIPPDYENLPDTNGTLSIYVFNEAPPLDYVKDGKLVGYEIDIITRFCKEKGYKPIFTGGKFSGVIPAVVSEKCDIGTGTITITEERAKSVNFSEPTHTAGSRLLVLKEQDRQDKNETNSKGHGTYKTLAELNGKTIGIQSGNPGWTQMAETIFPDSQILYFNTFSDLIPALLSDKIEAFFADLPIYEFMAAETDNRIAMIDENIDKPYKISFAFPKNEAGVKLSEQVNEYIRSIKASGELEEIISIWTGRDENKKVIPDYTKFPAPNGVLSLVTEGEYQPFNYIKDNKFAGLEIDIAARFCEKYGYGLKITAVTFDAIVAALAANKYDFAAASLVATDEHAETLLFSEPYYKSRSVVVVRNLSEQSVQKKYSDFQDLAGKKFAVVTGTITPEITKKNVPSAELVYFESVPDTLIALKEGKVDVICAGVPESRFMFLENDDIEYCGPQLDYLDIAPIFSKTEKGQKLCGQFSEFIKPLWEDGTIEKLDSKWFSKNESDRVLEDYSNLPAPNGKLKMAVDLSKQPFSFMKNGKIVGYDVDCAVRFCKAYGYGLEIFPMSFGAMIPAVLSGKCDFAASGIAKTEERAENVLFAYPNGKTGHIFVVMKNKISSNSKLPDFAGKTIGVQVGTTCADLVPVKFPSANVSYFNSITDGLTALKAGRINAMCCALPSAIYVTNTDKNVKILEPYLREAYLYSLFANSDKGKKLCEEYSAFIKSLWDNGTIDEFADKWLGVDESKKTIEDYTNLPAPNGVLKMGVDASIAPFAYVKDNKIVGHAVDLAVKFCKEKGYGLEISNMSLSAVLAAVKTGKCDFTQAMTKTKEREENTLFATSPNMKSGNVILVLKNEERTEITENKAQILPQNEFFEDIKESFDGIKANFEDIKASFGRTFIREDRYKLFIDGIIDTMIITILSIIFGTILGFMLFLFCRSGNLFANAITNFAVWLVKGTPVVVLLMILYYVIFGKVDIKGIWVAVIAFTMTFGSAFLGMLRFGTGAIDKGQTEASYALGFTDWQTFFTVILPQAAVHFMPTYKAEVTSLIKSTSIVGYIAVQDLTKMGDIVRSRTYEAFFPLIAVAAIYFVLAGILNFVVGIIQKSITPSRRKRENILHGINLTGGDENHD